MIPADVVHAVREALPLSSIISRTIRLKRAGREWVGSCPFHSDHKPSLTVNDQKGIWHCFPCNKGGDSIEWVRQSHGWTFAEALEELAKQAGITIPAASPEQAKRDARRSSDLELLAKARIFYQQELAKQPAALAYLKQRGVSDNAINAYGLGYAPPGIAGLATALGCGAGTGVLARLGLEVPERGEAQIRDRVIFPLSDTRGRTIGFAGRALDDRQPKYLNTPETEIFRKGSTLFGAAEARQQAHEGEPLAVVEGYLDVIAFWQAGIPAVAPMGTALTEQQLRVMWRLSDRPILCFDGDAAGAVATKRAISLSIAHLAPGVTLQAVQLRPGTDPGHYLAQGHTDQLKAILAHPTHLADAFWQLSTVDLNINPETLGQLEADMVEAYARIPSPQLREKYLVDMRSRVKALQRPRKVIRSNGHSLHSTNPATTRLLNGIPTNGMSLRDAVILNQVSIDPEMAVDRALSVSMQGIVSTMVSLAIEQPGVDWSQTSVANALTEAKSVMSAAGLPWGTGSD